MTDSVIRKAISLESQTVIDPFVLSRAGLRPQEASAFEDVQAFYRIMANQRRFASVNDAIQAMLQRACFRFRMKRGLVLQSISSKVYELKAAFDPEGELFVGQHMALESIPLLEKHNEFQLVVEPNLPQLALKSTHMSYTLEETAAYVGVTTVVGGVSSGVVCFVSDEAMMASFEQEDVLVLELLAEGIACMTELQTARAPRKTEDLAIFTSGSIKSLEEYQAAAELPEGLGISGKVVDVLKKRIGQSSLSIDNIADELNLSKRTLQRRLQQQGISFAELRDRVRFHYSIDLLVKQQISIDRISSTLDFSDRTSFTNAFKRWTGLSPSTFRKVFRDYV